MLLKDAVWHGVSKGAGTQGVEKLLLSVTAEAPMVGRVARVQMKESPRAGQPVTLGPDTEATRDGPWPVSF